MQTTAKSTRPARSAPAAPPSAVQPRRIKTATKNEDLVRERRELLVQAAVLLPFGVGGGLAVPALTTALLESVDADRAGLAAGLLNAGRQFGGALGVALFGTLAGSAVVTGLHVAAVVGAAILVTTVVATRTFVSPR